MLGQYQSGLFQESAAEILTYDPESQRGFLVNAGLTQVDVLDLSDPSQPTLVTSLVTSVVTSVDASQVMPTVLLSKMAWLLLLSVLKIGQSRALLLS
ncbi:MAG: hypothetical protein ACUVRV_11720 [Cyanobacteriota bacterium]